MLANENVTFVVVLLHQVKYSLVLKMCEHNNGDEDGIYSYFRSNPRDENVDEAENSHVRFRSRINDGNNDDTVTPFVQSSSRANVDDNEVPTSYFRSRPD